MKREWRIASAVILAALTSVAAYAGDCKPLRVTGKGVVYPFTIPAPDGGQTETLLIDPGRDAFLASARKTRELSCTRTGIGMQWNMVPDSRASIFSGFLYLECEPLAGRSFEDAAEAFQGRLKDIWDTQGVDLLRVVAVRSGKRLKILRKSVPGVQIVQDVRRRDNQWERPAHTTLFERNGALVALTYYGGSDTTGKILKSLKVASPKTWKKPITCHISDFHGAPRLGRFFTLPAPTGYACCSWAADIDEQEKGIVARWRAREDTGQPPATLTLRRMNWGGATDLAGDVAELGGAWEKEGFEVEEPAAYEIAGREGLTLVAKAPAGGTSDGPRQRWLVAWQMQAAVYGFVWEVDSPDSEAVSSARAEIAGALAKAKAWTAKGQ